MSIVMGLQIILIPWLAIDYLQLSSSAVGLVQAAVLIPNVLLIVGGMSADKGFLLKKFLILLFVYACLHSLLLFLLLESWLSFILILFYGLMLGSVGAFVQPYKDYMLGSLAGNNLQKTIAKNQFCQYLGQAIGIALASYLYEINLFLLPSLQIVLTLLAIVFFYIFYQFSNLEFQKVNQDKLKVKNLLVNGFQYCWQSSILRSLIFIAAVNGFFHIGVFVVALPLLVKTVYLGSVSFYGLLQLLFVAGTLTTTLLVIIKGQLDSPGRRMIFSLLYGGFILLAISAGPTQYGLFFLIYLWGIVVGISATLGRAILQSQSGSETRGRAISIYQFALFGCTPLGSLCAGFAIEHWGILMVLKLSAYASFFAFAALFFTKALWDVEAEDTQSTQ